MTGSRSHRWVLAIPAAFALVALSIAPVMATDGDLDGTFGVNGLVTTAFPVGSFATAVAVQADGRIVAAGAAAGPSVTGEIAVARYEANGSLDGTFGDGGMVTTPIGVVGGDEARAVAIQGNGRIVVAGTDSWQRFAVLRYLPDGTLDPTFGGNGIVRTNFTPSNDVAWDMAIQEDGKIVAVGAAGFGQTGFQLARYRHDGSLDPTFGDGGKVVTRYHGANARATVVQPNGRIVVAGYQPGGLALARYLSNGSLDRRFSGDGMIEPVSRVWAQAVALQPDGRIVVAGDEDIFAFGLARFLPDGRLDRSFGGDGTIRQRVDGGEQGANGLVIQDDGRIVATGSSGPHEGGDTTVSRFVLIRRLADGRRDTTFGVDGEVRTFFEEDASAHGSAVDPEGRIVVVGGEGEASIDAFALARYIT